MASVDPTIARVADASLQRLAKWRSVFAGWQLGTRPRTLTRIVGEEAEYLSAALERKFPGAKAVDVGMDFQLPEWADTMRKLGFPP